MTSIHNESGKYSFLWDLSNEELERLLQQEFIASDDRELDEDYFMAIVEVMKSREEVTPEDRKEAKAAWKNFQENYMDQSDAYEFVPFPKIESSTNNQINRLPKTKHTHHFVRVALIAATLLGVLGGIASATGWLEAILTWTTETFGFVSPRDKGDSDILSDDPYADLRNIMAGYTDLAVVPNWAPEGTQMESDVRVLEQQNETTINCRYQADDAFFTLTYRIYETMPERYFTGYEKSTIEDAHEHDGIQYKVSRNNSKYTIIWYNEYIEGTLQGNLSYEDLIEMVDSI